MNLLTINGILISADGSTYYKLTDHNREPIDISYELVESTQRMANGTLRKYVVAKKFKITASWKNLPTLDSELVDSGKSSVGAAWIKAFYEGNAFAPISIKLYYAKEATPAVGSVPDFVHYSTRDVMLETGGITPHVESAFMTNFNYTVTKRMPKYDYVDMSIEFTEI